jgi:phosphatidylglycerol:prolipoprotein diacylglycerol transferase
VYPELAKIGPIPLLGITIPIHTYGFLIAIGFLCAVSIIKRLAARSKLDIDQTLDLTFWSLLIGFIGARILFIITRFSSFMADPIAMFKVWEGGLVFLGGPIAVIPFVIWYVRKHRMPIWKTLDTLAPGLVVAHMFGRFGCLSAGCCYGKPTGTSFGVRLYSDLVDRPLQGIPLHPTQLYEASSLFILFLGLLYVFKNKKFDGQVALTYLLTYPIIRSIIEVFRGDLIRGFIIDDVLSTSQFISILVFIAAGVTLFIRLKQVRENGGGLVKEVRKTGKSGKSSASAKIKGAALNKSK